MNIDVRNYQAAYGFVLDGELEDVDMHASDIENDYRIRDRITDDTQYREAVQKMNFDRLAREGLADKSLPWAVGRQDGTLLDVALQTLFMVVGT